MNCRHFAEPSNCYNYGQSKQYSGNIRETENGNKCMDWKLYEADSSYPNRPYVIDSNFPDGSIVTASNYCRSPDEDERPWCFIDDTENWKFCSVSECSGNILTFIRNKYLFKFMFTQVKSSLCNTLYLNESTIPEP